MTITDALGGIARVFLDTAPVIYFVEQNPAYFARVDVVFDGIDAGTLTAVTSSVTLAETLIHPIRLGLTQLQQDCHDLIVQGRNTIFVPVGARQARRAAELRVRYNLTLTDAFQIACALDAGCDAFLTNDTRLRRVTELSVIVLDGLQP